MWKNFNSMKLFNEHIRLDKDCSIYYKLDYLTYKTCPNEGCNTIWKSYKDLEKHLEFHCHLNQKEKEQISFNNDELQTIDRRNFYQRGLPSKDTYLSNGNIHYNATLKIWTCMICKEEFQKYDWKQITMHVNSKHTDKEFRKNKWNNFKEKGNKDFAIDKEIAFNRVRLKLEFNDETQEFDKILKCTFPNCSYETMDKERILGHLPKHGEIQKNKGLHCPYCAPSFAKLYTLTRHLYETSCPKLKKRIQNDEIIDWKQIWKDTVQINNIN